MARKKLPWTHKKYGKRQYFGFYVRTNGERILWLEATLKNGRAHHVAYESHEAATRDGWMR